MRRHLSKTGIALAFALMFVLAARTVAQTKPESPTSGATQKTSASPSKSEDAKSQSAAAPLTPEQAQLQAQIEKLYQLAQDLKAAVAKSNKDTLSIDVIKKADAVEKAAKSLKDQMKSSQQTADHH